MNHNQDLAFNSLKIISNQDSYSKNSGCLILNGGLGCKKTINAECINVKNLDAEKFSVNKFDGTVNFDNIISSSINSLTSSTNTLNSKTIYFENIFPSSNMSTIGSSENKIPYINSINLESDNIVCNLESFFKNCEIENSIIKDLKYENITALNENAQIGDLNNRIPIIYVEKINSTFISSDEGNFSNLIANFANIERIKTSEINSTDLKIDNCNVSNLTCLESSIELCKVDLLLPKNNDSSIGDDENRVNIFSDLIDSERITSIEINSNKLNVENINVKKIVSESLNTKNLEINKIDAHEINCNDLTSSNINVQKLMPFSYSSKIGNVDNRFEIFSNNLLSINLESSYILGNSIDSIENVRFTSNDNGGHIINTFREESKCEIQCDLFSINASKDKLFVSDDGIEYDNLNIKKYHLINDKNINDIYPIKSTIIVDLRCCKEFNLRKSRFIEDRYNVKEGTTIEIINFGDEDIFIENIKITQCEKCEFMFYLDEWRVMKPHIMLQDVSSHVNSNYSNNVNYSNGDDSQLTLGNIFNNED